MNERLPDMTLMGCYCITKEKKCNKRYNKEIILIRSLTFEELFSLTTFYTVEKLQIS
jgi:hypothetical protein